MAKLAIFNDSNNLLDLVPAVSTGPSTPGCPVLTNSSGVIDATLIALPSAIVPAQRTVTASTTVTLNDGSIFANASSANLTVTLPDASSCPGYAYTVKKVDSSTNSVTVATTNSQTIDGSANVVLTTAYQRHTVQSFGTGWYIIN